MTLQEMLGPYFSWGGMYYHYMLDEHIVPDLAYRVAVAQGYLLNIGGEYMEITSGYRDPARQLQLQNRWDSGDRAGLTSRPATYSWHMQGRAVDVQWKSPSIEVFIRLLKQWDVRWGGDFKRPSKNHFDWPHGGERKSITELLLSENYYGYPSTVAAKQATEEGPTSGILLPYPGPEPFDEPHPPTYNPNPIRPTPTPPVVEPPDSGILEDYPPVPEEYLDDDDDGSQLTVGN